MKEASFLDTVKTVLSGFIGIRRRSAHEDAKIKPAHVIVAGVIGAALFVLTLVTIVRIVTH
ncbi:MAG TPA: DUF2970 domain-containing protein [Burkholderiales bacterium]|nr:DUF2970 domain-containing protein [Burkholderiales bacterium]